MRSIESTGKTVEDAVQSGLARLGLELPDVSIEVLDEGSKGFFGLFGAKPAKVRITERDREPEIDMSQILRPGASTRVSTIADKPRAPRPAKPAQAKLEQVSRPAQPRAEQVNKPAQPKAEQVNKPTQPKPEQSSKPAQPKSEQSSKPTQPKAEQVAQPKAEQSSKPAQSRQPASRPGKPAQAKPARANRAPRPHDDERPVIPDGPLPDQDPATLSEAGHRAYEYLDKLTQLMGVKVKIYVAEAGGNMSISMMGDTLGILIGRRGDTLDALQYLTSLEVNKDSGDSYIRVSLDTEHYRAKREDSLVRLASRMADRAVKTGRKVVLEPMNPYERRVLHATLQNHPLVQTHSEGDEPNRRVVITLKSEAMTDGAEGAPARPHRRPERRDGKPNERREDRGPRPDRPRPPKPPRAAEAEPAPVANVPMAHDVPEDPTDDTI